MGVQLGPPLHIFICCSWLAGILREWVTGIWCLACLKLNSSWLFPQPAFLQCFPSPLSDIPMQIARPKPCGLSVILSTSNSLSSNLSPYYFHVKHFLCPTCIEPVHLPPSHYCYSSLRNDQCWTADKAHCSPPLQGDQCSKLWLRITPTSLLNRSVASSRDPSLPAYPLFTLVHLH